MMKNNHLSITASLFAIYASTNFFASKITDLYEIGITLMVALLLHPISWIITNILLAKNVSFFKKNTSIIGIMKSQYGVVAYYVTIFSVLMYFLYFCAIQITISISLLEAILSIKYQYAFVISIMATLAYYMMHNPRTLVLSEILLFSIIFIVIPIACGFLYYNAGGYNKIIQNMPNDYFTVHKSNSNTVTLGVLILYNLLPCTNPLFLQKIFLVRNVKERKVSLNMIALFSAVVCFLCCVIAILLKNKKMNFFTTSHHQEVFYWFIECLPTPVKMILFIVFFISVQYTATAWINYIYTDVFKKLSINITSSYNLPKFFSKSIEKPSFFAIIIICIIAVLILSKNSIELLEFGMLIYTLLFVPIIAIFLKIKANHITFIISSVVVSIFAIYCKYISHHSHILTIIASIMLSGVVFSFIHILQLIQSHQFSFKCIKINLNAISRIKNKLKENLQRKSVSHIVALYLLIKNIPPVIFEYHDPINAVSFILYYIGYIVTILAFILLLCEIYYFKHKNLIYYLTLWLAFPCMNTYYLASCDYDLVVLVNCVFAMATLFILVDHIYALIINLCGILVGITTYEGITIISGIRDAISMPHDDLDASLYNAIIRFTFIFYILYKQIGCEIARQQILTTIGNAIAHDLKTPMLNSIVMAKLIENALLKKSYAKIIKNAKNLQQNALKAMQYIDIMTHSMSFDTKTTHKDWGKFSIKKCVYDAVNNYYTSNDNKEKIIVSNRCTDFSIMGSPILLTHIIHNLLDNAFKYAGSPILIHISILPDNRLSIKDNGNGMDEKIMEHLYEKYITTGGTGIGLNFCKLAMQKMNGDIDCISAKNQGTEFILSFFE